MELKEILSVSKLPGLYRVIATRDNGLIVSPLGEDKKKFVSSRQHMFTPLENITIYTTTGSIELVKIFEEIKHKETELPLPEKKASSKKYREYFTSLVPDHDQEKVYDNDIKKIVKWYSALDSHGLIIVEKEEKKAPKKKTKATGDKTKATKKTKTKKDTKKKDK